MASVVENPDDAAEENGGNGNAPFASFFGQLSTLLHLKAETIRPIIIINSADDSLNWLFYSCHSYFFSWVWEFVSTAAK